LPLLYFPLRSRAASPRRRGLAQRARRSAMRRWLAGLVLPALLAACAHPPPATELHLEQPVVLLGEVHDNAAQHALRLRAFEARLATGARPALVMEQFDRERQDVIDELRAQQPAPDADALIAAAGSSVRRAKSRIARAMSGARSQRIRVDECIQRSTGRMMPVARQREDGTPKGPRVGGTRQFLRDRPVSAGHGPGGSIPPTDPVKPDGPIASFANRPATPWVRSLA